MRRRAASGADAGPGLPPRRIRESHTGDGSDRMRAALSRKNAKGFSLIEVALGLAFAGLLVSSFLSNYKWQSQKDSILDTLARREVLRVALEKYLVLNTRLPCPAD